MRLRRYRPVAVLLLVVQLGACMTWQPVALSPQRLIAEEDPSVVRVIRLDQSELVLADPIIRNDSMIGLAESRQCERRPGEMADRCIVSLGSAGVPVSDVDLMDVKRFSVGWTAAAVLSPFVFVGFIVGVSCGGSVYTC